MKNKILIGVLLAVFLMLMLPVNSAVESDVVENNQTINKKDILEKRILTIINLLLRKIEVTHPEVYDKINEKLNDYSDEDPPICIYLGIIWGLCLITIVLIPIGIIALEIARSMDCEWTAAWEPRFP